MDRAFIMWHYLHAEKRKVQLAEEREQQNEFFIALIRPDIYAKMKEQSEEVENATFVETTDSQGRVVSTIDADEFRRMAQERMQRLKNIKVVKRYVDGEELPAGPVPEESNTSVIPSDINDLPIIFEG